MRPQAVKVGADLEKQIVADAPCIGKVLSGIRVSMRFNGQILQAPSRELGLYGFFRNHILPVSAVRTYNFLNFFGVPPLIPQSQRWRTTARTASQKT